MIEPLILPLNTPECRTKEKHPTNTLQQLPAEAQGLTSFLLSSQQHLPVSLLVYFISFSQKTNFPSFAGPFEHVSPSLEAQSQTRSTEGTQTRANQTLQPVLYHLPSPPRCPPCPWPQLAAPTHHDRDVKNVHLLLHYLRRLLEAGRGGPGELLGAAHGDVEVQGAVLQPLLLPVHQRDVSHRPRHLCRDRTHNPGSAFCTMLEGRHLAALQIRAGESLP